MHQTHLPALPRPALPKTASYACIAVLPVTVTSVHAPRPARPNRSARPLLPAAPIPAHSYVLRPLAVHQPWWRRARAVGLASRFLVPSDASISLFVSHPLFPTAGGPVARLAGVLTSSAVERSPPFGRQLPWILLLGAAHQPIAARLPTPRPGVDHPWSTLGLAVFPM